MAKKKNVIVLVSSILAVILLAITISLFGLQMALPEVHADIPHADDQQEMPDQTINHNEAYADTELIFPTITPIPLSQATATPTALPLQAFTGTNNEPETVSLEEIADDNAIPDTVFSIGFSVEGRELTMYRFGSGDSHRLIIAGIHGGYEYNTTDLAFELIAHIEKNPDTIPKNVTLFIFPSLNPDGLAHSKWYEGRANANGVDLNRNWDFNWKATWNPFACWSYLPIHGGDHPFSEPETIALRDFIFDNDISAIISYHSAALGIFAGGMPTNTISVPLAEAVSEVSPYPFPPLDFGCEMTGQFIDYVASHGIPALDVELANHRDTDFQINLRILETFLSWSH
jgi:hypothetical protein